jgi:hypothetical protein
VRYRTPQYLVLVTLFIVLFFVVLSFCSWLGIIAHPAGDVKALVALELILVIHEFVVDKYETSYDSNFKGDKDIGAKVLGLVDLAFFQFCDSCIRASSPDDVDFSLISLHNNCFDIIQNCFQANKPAYLIPSKPATVDSDDDDRSRGRDNKKKKVKLEKDKDKDPPGGPKDLGSLIRNPNPNKD